MDEHRWLALLSAVQVGAERIGADQQATFGRVAAEAKADGSLVTECDRRSDQALRALLSDLLPEAGFLTEELGQTMPASEWVWVVDPLDGTTNFARGIPIWAISVALLHRGQPVLGVVHLPVLGRTYRGLCPATVGLTGPTLAEVNRTSLVPAATFSASHLFSFCTRSIGVLQADAVREQAFPCKIRMLGVATYNLLSVLESSTVGALEATPRVWDVAALVAIARAVGLPWHWLRENPFPLQPGVDYATQAYPTLLVAQPALLETFAPWRDALAALA